MQLMEWLMELCSRIVNLIMVFVVGITLQLHVLLQCAVYMVLLLQPLRLLAAQKLNCIRSKYCLL